MNKDEHGEHESGPKVTDKRQAGKLAEDPEALQAQNDARIMAKRAWVGAHYSKDSGADGLTLTPEQVDEIQAMDEPELDERIIAIQAGEGQENLEMVEHQGVTAFLVLVGHDGSAIGIANIDAQVAIDRPANPWDMYNGCAQVMRDLGAMETANRVLIGLQQMGSMAAEARNVRQVAQTLHRPGRR